MVAKWVWGDIHSDVHYWRSAPLALARDYHQQLLSQPGMLKIFPRLKVVVAQALMWLVAVNCLHAERQLTLQLRLRFGQR